MKEYHKIVTVWERNPETKFKTLIEGVWAEPEFEYLKDNDWVWTEKVDGTNIRIMWDGEKVRYGGKTDNAQIPEFLIERLQSLFYAGALARIFDGIACLYGEGYGAKIQKAGGNYIADGVDFCLFDVLIGETWLRREDVEDIAGKLEIHAAPIVGTGSLEDAIDICRGGIKSRWGDFMSEGLVMRPKIEMKNRMGRRIITKIKYKDFDHRD